MREIAVNGRGPIPDDRFGRVERVPMTKAPVRALLVSLLAPLSGARVLEIGTGSGGATVELLRAVGESGRVTSVERLPEALAVARENIARFGFAERAELIGGSAPESLPPGPFDAVFIGGHGEELEKIMKACLEVLSPGGRMLLTAISPRTSYRALSCFEALGIVPGFWRIQTAVGRKVGLEWLPIGNNPIDVIWGDK